MTTFRAFSVRGLSLPLLSLALLTLVAGASATLAAPAEAQVILLPRKFTIMVTFDRVDFATLDDCPASPFWFCNSADLYGTLSAKSSSQPLGSGVRNLATWGNSAGCYGFWDDNLSQDIACAKMVRDPREGPSPWRALPLLGYGCGTSTSFNHCDGPHTLNNNSVVVTMRNNDTLTVGAMFVDYDSFTGDDTLCNLSTTFGPFPSTQLNTLDVSGLTMASGFNGDGACSVKVSLKRIG
jgi:hypothetical protein